MKNFQTYQVHPNIPQNLAFLEILSRNMWWCWKKEAIELLKKEERILRPLNFPESAPGKGVYIFKTFENTEVMILNVQGRVFMEPVVDNPFTKINERLEQTEQKIIFVDFHAEATAEKQAMGYYLDGKVSAVLGTHTHVQTADLRILEQGTAYQTDVGMTGAFDSIIGMKREPVIQKFLTGVNQKFEVARENIILDMSILDIDKSSGKTLKVQPIRIYESSFETQLDFH